MEKRLLLKRKLHVVSSHWLEDSLQREQKQSEDVYTLRPKCMEQSDTEESDKSEHVSTEVASGGSVQTEEPASSKMESTSSRGQSNTRAVKRGRSSTISQQRVQRCRGKQPSKIGGDETESDASEEKVSTRLGDIAEETDSFGEPQRNSMRGKSAKRGKSRVGQPQRVQRSRRDKKPSKLGGDDSEENDDFDDKTNESTDVEKSNAAGRSVEKEETREPDVAKYTEPLQRDNTVLVTEASQDSKNAKSEIDMKEKLQIHEDPVQAMLMNMIPSLSMKNTETSNRITGESRKAANVSDECESSEKRKLSAETDTTTVNAGTVADAEAVPPSVKKKKVSYRDVAGELLKDW